MKNLAILLFSLIATNLYSVEFRTPDYIMYKGQTSTISNSPMELYFEIYPYLTPKPDIGYLQTNKNYSAVFELKDSVLFLIEINVIRLFNDSSCKEVNVITEVFNGQTRVKMDWLTTILIIEPKNFQTGEYEIIHIEKGILTTNKRAKLRKVEKLKHRLFEDFTRTDQFLEIEKRYSGWKYDDIEKIVIGDRILEYTSQIDKNKTPHNKE